MELSLIREKLSFSEHIFTEHAAAEESMDMIVPDALPDITRIICAEGEVFVRGKEADNGKVTVHGVVRTYVLYVPESDGAIRHMSMEIPYSITMSDARITAGTRVSARVRLESVDAHAVNPRKVSARASVRAGISCYNETDIDVPTAHGFEDNADIETLTGEAELSLPGDVCEKTFIVMDEVALPGPGPQFGEILSSRSAVVPEESKVVGTKLVFRGTAHTDILYSSPDGEVYAANFKIEFSQIMELENANEDSVFELIPLVTGAYVEPIPGAENDAQRLSIEIHAVCQTVALTKRRLSYVSDVYGTKYDVDANFQTIKTQSRTAAHTGATVLRGTLPAENAARVVSVSARVGACETHTENDEPVIRAGVHVTGIYATQDGELRSAAATFDASAALTNVDGIENLVPHAETGRDLYGIAADGGIEIRVPVEFFTAEIRDLEFAPLSGITYDDETPIDNAARPSLVIARAKRGDTLWSIAKRYRATQEMVREANGMESGGVNEGEMLVVPKRR